MPIAVDYATIAASNIGQYFRNCLPILQVKIEDLSKLSPDFMDVKGATTWQESLQIGHQVRYEGTLSASTIKSILLVDYDSLDIVHQCSNWEELHKYMSR